jgi:hypothetical protein
MNSPVVSNTCASASNAPAARHCEVPGTHTRVHINILGVFVTREHVRHNKSGITHRGKTRISH